MDESTIKESKWRGKYKSLREYYYNVPMTDPETGEPLTYKDTETGEEKVVLLYDPRFYEFDKYQLAIDPDETMENVEKYTPQQRRQEFIKCAQSFAYFCHKYVKILHPLRGLVPFVLYKYQTKVIRDYEKFRFNIISKFRQGGLTTVTLLWGMWRCMFQMDQQVMLLSKTDREATDIGLMVDRALENLPTWLMPKREGKWNDHHKQFSETGGALKFYSPEAARGKSVTFLIIDEAAFIPEMEKHWKAMWPVLSTGGSCALVSTVNGLGNWYEETYHGAKEDPPRNRFHIIDLDYWEHPDYVKPGWKEEQLAQLGDKGFAQEVMRSFLGSGDTWLPTHIIVELEKQTKEAYPIRKLFKRWVNKSRVGDVEGSGDGFSTKKKAAEDIEGGTFDRGALWVWKEPVDGHEYIIGVDTAEGVGEQGDNSCFQVLDTATLEQVAEFYSQEIPPHLFSQVLNEVGIYYNQALIVVEDMAPGGAVISNLQHELFYENLYYEPKAKKPGIKVGRVNRPIHLESLQHRLLNGSARINSRRLVKELHTFEYNPATKRAEPQKGKHDDAIMAMAMALFVRDTLLRDIPMGAEVPAEITAAFKTQIYEEIKIELKRGAPVNIIEEEIDLLAGEKEDVMPGVIFNFNRRYDKLLREFGW
jgi:hypothetical protein